MADALSPAEKLNEKERVAQFGDAHMTRHKASPAVVANLCATVHQTLPVAVSKAQTVMSNRGGNK